MTKVTEGCDFELGKPEKMNRFEIDLTLKSQRISEI